MSVPFSWLTEEEVQEMKNLGWTVDDFEDATGLATSTSGTGWEQDLFAAIAQYLQGVEKKVEHARLPSREAQRLHACAAELANRANFVDYGVSLRTAWLTDRGRAWLASYLEHYPQHVQADR